MGESPSGNTDTRRSPPSGMEATPAHVSHRNKRIKVLDAIVTCLQMKKPDWQKARILHLSTQLEDSIFNSKESLAEYGDGSTLPARINHHCLLLATRKAASSNPAQQVTSSSSSSSSAAAAAATAAARSIKRGVSSTFVLGPPPARASSLIVVEHVEQGVKRDERPGEAERTIVSSSGSTVGGNVGQEEVEGQGVAAEHRSVMLPAPPVYSDGSNTHYKSHSGDTTEDDMDDDGDEEEDYNAGDKAKNAYATTAASSAALLSRAHASAPLSSVVASLADAVVAAPAAAPATAPTAADTTRAPPEEEGGNEVNDEDYAVAAAGIAAASVGGSQWRGDWSGEMHAADPLSFEAGAEVGEVVQLFGNRQQPKSQPHPEATVEEVRQHALRLLECRLLLLTHASACSEEEGCCRLAPLCESVRQLLRHIHACGDTKSCEFPHCASSKAVLQHKRMCTDSACELCCSVKDISQKCFWANARHLHKRRLEESQELRRKKRQSEGKAVAPPRKLQAEKAKGGKEICSGLDEAGNDLGDISLGFFLRQADKTRKVLSEENRGDENLITSASTVLDNAVSFETSAPATSSSAAAVLPTTNEHADTTAAFVGNKRCHESVAGLGASLSAGETAQASCASSALPTWSPKPSHSEPQQPPSPLAQHRDLESTREGPSAEAQVTNGKDNDTAMGTEDNPVGGAETRATGAASGDSGVGGHGLGGHHDGDGTGHEDKREAAEIGGALTVVIPPLAPEAFVGHLRSPSEIMLDDIAESLADTTRKPSFARMQSVQAFLNDHVELRQSASFGDVSAMVEQWMSLEENNDEEHLEENGMGGAFSF